MESIAPKGIVLEVRLIHSGDPIVVSTDNRLRKGRDEGDA